MLPLKHFQGIQENIILCRLGFVLFCFLPVYLWLFFLPAGKYGFTFSFGLSTFS